METYDCDPTMTDTEVMEFSKRGFLVLEGIVPPEIDLKTLAYLDAFYETQPPDLPERTATIPTDLFSKGWFRNNVVLHPKVTGVLRSLLGKDFTLPEFLSNHRIRCPMPADVPGQKSHLWHRDGAGGGGVPGLERVDFSKRDSLNGAQNCLQVFYYPQDVPLVLGPTELVPGSHLIQGQGQYEVDYFLGLLDDHRNVANSYFQVAPAGSITITCYSIWHRRPASTGVGIRNNLKYRYSRTVRPRHDWTAVSGFRMPGPGQGMDAGSDRDIADAADMFAWLSGGEPWLN